MKVQTHLRAGITAQDVFNGAKQTVAAAADTVSGAAGGLAQGISNIGQNPTAVRVWYWPLNAPATTTSTVTA